MEKVLLRFYSCIIDCSDENACWEWSGVMRGDYGGFFTKNKYVMAHRFIYEYYIGSIPVGHVIDHKCGNKRCVNLFHLEAVTIAENNKRAYRLKDVCKGGHMRTQQNTYIAANGSRHCRECRHLLYLNRKYYNNRQRISEVYNQLKSIMEES